MTSSKKAPDYDLGVEKSLKAFQAKISAAEKAKAGQTPPTLSTAEVKAMLDELDKDMSTNTSADARRARATIQAAKAYMDKPDPTMSATNVALTLSALRHNRSGVVEQFELQLKVNELAAADMKECKDFELTTHTPSEKEAFYKARMDSIQANSTLANFEDKVS
jgi:hypothetical protein